MKHRGINAGLLLAGVLVGLSIGSAAHAVGEYLTATPSTQTFYVNDQRVELEAYAIAGHNYVKLRDVGQVVDFNVCYDPNRNAVVMEPDKPYTGEDVAMVEPPPSSPPVSGTDYAAQANPAIFTGDLTREVYNAIRDTVVNRNAILSGSQEPQAIEWSIGAHEVMDTVTAAMGNYPAYEALSMMGGKLMCGVKNPEAYAQAVAHTQSFLNSISGMSQTEQVQEIAWYVCDHMTYSTAIASPTEILASDGVTAGNCMSYAHSFMFLCNRANIPCIVLHSETHQWNKVYAGGQWWDVDVSSLDVADDTSLRPYSTVLCTSDEMQGVDFINAAPEITAFAMEIFVPSSTK